MKKNVSVLCLAMITLGGLGFIAPTEVGASTKTTTLQASENNTPYDVGYFANHYIDNTPHRLDPNPRVKLVSSKNVSITINHNSYGEIVKYRAVSPSTGYKGPWVYFMGSVVTGTLNLPNEIPAGETVVPEAVTKNMMNSTYVSGSWYHN